MSFKLPVLSDDKLYRGDTIRIYMTLMDGDSAQDLTDFEELWFTAKKVITDNDAAATTIQKTLGDGIEVLDAVEGRILITLDPADTANNTDTQKYVCDVQGRDDADIHTFDDGEMTITVDVTRAT